MCIGINVCSNIINVLLLMYVIMCIIINGNK